MAEGPYSTEELDEIRESYQHWGADAGHLASRFLATIDVIKDELHVSRNAPRGRPTPADAEEKSKKATKDLEKKVDLLTAEVEALKTQLWEHMLDPESSKKVAEAILDPSPPSPALVELLNPGKPDKDK